MASDATASERAHQNQLGAIGFLLQARSAEIMLKACSTWVQETQMAYATPSEQSELLVFLMTHDMREFKKHQLYNKLQIQFLSKFIQ